MLTRPHAFPAILTAIVMLLPGVVLLAEEPTSVNLPCKLGETWTNSMGMTFVHIPAGEFMMGSPPEEPDRREEERQHRVKITRPFLMQTTPVTQGQWKAVMGGAPRENDAEESIFDANPHPRGENPSQFQGDDQLPVERVYWQIAAWFCQKLSLKESRTYRLPTEAEWEYACRAGTTTAYNTGDGEEALAQAGWYHGNSGRRTHPVGQKTPNAWGLYDMHGNVYEWCLDGRREYPQESEEMIDPIGPTEGNTRVYRGGQWNLRSVACRSAARSGHNVVNNSGTWGLRVILYVKDEPGLLSE